MYLFIFILEEQEKQHISTSMTKAEKWWKTENEPTDILSGLSLNKLLV